jgi:hypothetical protein
MHKHHGSPLGTLTVNVVRNTLPPVITNLPNTTTITASQLVNQELFRVTARDDDTRVSYI